MSRKPLLVFTDKGIYCPQGKFFIDPWKPVNRAIITHAHSDHARWGSKYYLSHLHSIPVLKHRLGHDITCEGIDYGEPRMINGVQVTFFPAGHIPGSAQARVTYKDEVWVASGDYKTEDDGFCTPFEPVGCHTFITESTFGLPIYKWEKQADIFKEVNQWWQKNKSEGKASILCGYALGKAQRMLTNIDPSIGKIFVHGAIHNTNEALLQAGLKLPDTERVTADTNKKEFPGSLIVAPPSALGSSWIRKFRPYSSAIGSGWMNLRGAKRRRAVDRGFILSDHADWNGLNEAVKATGAQKVFVTHGYTAAFSFWLKGKGIDAEEVKTQYEGELSEINEGSSSQNTEKELNEA
ncbi:ligase-associated DNA damage response exonuclease [Roseivirga sp. BDSF3-8]|uniref:ligase-associated DNA damage response exonuclease n=1 Tax=Roseivirga sp. BDSF3-8 TaxID=3241598 RepID=UPI0035318583